MCRHIVTSFIKVLIIEDDLAIAEIHRRNMMKMTGFEVIGIASSIADAHTLLELLNPDLVLLDVYLPDGNGLDLLRSIRQQKHACDVILITADREVTTLQEAMRGGVVDYILKPVVFERLQASLDKYKKQLNRLDCLDDLDQSVVDSMISTANKQTVCARLPKGIDGLTLDKVRGLFNFHQAMTADKAGELIGASRTTARRYLEHLISTEEIRAELHYGTVGRPERTYTKVAR
jgi:two-component system CitB family response regulator